MLCDDLERWNLGVGGRLKREGMYVSMWLIHVVVQQKLMQHCKAIIFQFKEKKKGSGLPFQGWTHSGAVSERGSSGPVASALGPRTADGDRLDLHDPGEGVHSHCADSWLSLALLRKAFQGVGMPSSIYRPAGRKFPS